MKNRKTFIAACLGITQETYSDWAPSMICRYCKQTIEPNDLELAVSYWTLTGQGPLWEPCHKGCKAEGYKREAYECQCVDGDCNDCRHFLRDQGQTGRIAFMGTCQRFHLPTVGRPNHASDMPCFTHRRATEETGRDGIPVFLSNPDRIFPGVDPSIIVAQLKEKEKAEESRQHGLLYGSALETEGKLESGDVQSQATPMLSSSPVCLVPDLISTPMAKKGEGMQLTQSEYDSVKYLMEELADLSLLTGTTFADDVRQSLNLRQAVADSHPICVAAEFNGCGEYCAMWRSSDYSHHPLRDDPEFAKIIAEMEGLIRQQHNPAQNAYHALSGLPDPAVERAKLQAWRTGR